MSQKEGLIEHGYGIHSESTWTPSSWQGDCALRRPQHAYPARTSTPYDRSSRGTARMFGLADSTFAVARCQKSRLETHRCAPMTGIGLKRRTTRRARLLIAVWQSQVSETLDEFASGLMTWLIEACPTACAIPLGKIGRQLQDILASAARDDPRGGS